MSATKILLVEGIDDQHVFENLCLKRGILLNPKDKPNEGIHIKELKGVDKLLAWLEDLEVFLMTSDIKALGVVIDADIDLAARWDSIKARLHKAEYQDIPALPSPDGTIISPPPDKLLPRVGIWIMPDNQATGMLEDFLRFLVPTGSLLFDHVESSVASIPDGERRFSLLAKPKAIMHTWLAWQEEPGKPLGLAINCHYLEHEVAQVDVLILWLNRLFFEEF